MSHAAHAEDSFPTHPGRRGSLAKIQTQCMTWVISVLSGEDLPPISGLDFHASYFSNIACLVQSVREHMLHLRTVQTLTLILFLYCSQWIRCLHEQLSLWQWH